MHLPTKNPIPIPTNKDIGLARESSKRLAAYLQKTNEPILKLIQKGKGGEVVAFPAEALKQLVIILSQMAKGNAVTLVPVHAELTTQEAANLLSVSRPYLVNLLKEGKIPFHRVGSRRRVFAKDVLRYKEQIDNKRLEILNELAKEAQNHNMGY